MDLEDLLPRHPTERRMRCIVAIVLQQLRNTVAELRHLGDIIGVCRRHERRSCADSSRRITTEKLRQQPPPHQRTQKRKQRHPFRIAIHTWVLNQYQMLAYLPKRPLAIPAIAAAQKQLGLSDRGVQIVEMQFT